jgi:transposase
MQEKNSVKQPNRKYSSQFKEQAVERAAKAGVPKAAKDLGIAESLIYSWRSKKRQIGIPFEDQKLKDAELAKLRRECKRLEQEVEFLKKAAAYFAVESNQSTQ